MMISLRDVAHAAGVSKTTASLALRDSPEISAVTRRRVQLVAKDLGYQPSAVVSDVMAAFRKGTPRFQGMLALVNVHPYEKWLEAFPTFRQWTRAAAERATEMGFALERFWLHASGISPTRLAQILEARGSVGVLLAGVEHGGRLPDSAELLWERFPSVVLGVRPEPVELHCVLNNHFESVRLATLKALERGHRRVGLVLWKDLEKSLHHRFFLGYQSALLDAPGIRALPPLELTGLDERAFRAWMKSYKPDAVLAHDPAVCRWLGKPANAAGRAPFVALLDLDDQGGLPGIWQQNEVVGRYAVEIVAAQVHRGESGPPRVATAHLIKGIWRDG